MVSVQLLICSDFGSQYVYVTNNRIGSWPHAQSQFTCELSQRKNDITLLVDGVSLGQFNLYTLPNYNHWNLRYNDELRNP